MYQKLPPLKSLLAFSAASKTLNYSLAAQELFITQSAISHQIKNLEQFLGHKLFYREGKQLKLTDNGLLLSTTVNQSLNQITHCVEEITGHHTSAYQFGVSSSFAIHRLTTELSGFNQQNENIDLRLKLLMCGDAVADLDLDIILYNRPIDHISYDCEHIKTETYIPVASPEFAKKIANRTIDEIFIDETVIELQQVNMWQTWRAINAINTPINKPLYFSDTILMLQAVLSHQGVALLGESLIRKELESGLLVKITDTKPIDINDGFYFAWHKRRKHDPKIRQLKNWLIGLI